MQRLHNTGITHAIRHALQDLAIALFGEIVALPALEGCVQGALEPAHEKRGLGAHLLLERDFGLLHDVVPLGEALNDVVVLDPLHQEPHMDLLVDILPQKAKAARSWPQLKAPSKVGHHFTVVLLLLTPCV